MNERKQNSTNYPYLFFLTLSSDHITGATGLTPTVTVSKNGGAFAAAAGAVTEVGNGWYALAGNATDRNTLGTCAVHASAAGTDPFDGKQVVVPWDPFDPNLALVALPASAPGNAGGLPTVDANNSVKLQSGTGPNQLNLTGGAVTVGSNNDKAGYALTQTFPANFSTLAVSASGAVTAGTVSDKSGYSLSTAAPTPAQIATAVWTDTTASDFTAAGSPGKAVLSNLDTNVGSRSTYAGGPVASVVGNVGGSVAGSVGSVAGVSFPTNFSTLAINAGGAVTVGSNNDKAGYSLTVAPPTPAQIATAVWTDTTASDFTTAGSPGKTLVSNLDTNVGSRLSSAAYVASAAPTPAQIATAVWTDTTASDFTAAGSPGKAVLSNLDTNVGSRSTYAGGPVASVVGNVGGSVAGSVGSVAGVSFPTNFSTLAINAGGAVTVGSNNDKAGYALSANGLDAISVESGVNARQAVSAILASAVGVLSGAATNTITILGGNVAAPRVVATVDASGNRSAISLSLPREAAVFALRFFCSRYFGGRFWAKVGGAATSTASASKMKKWFPGLARRFR